MSIRDLAYIMAFGASFIGFAIGNMVAHFSPGNREVNIAMDVLIYATAFIIGGFLIISGSFGLSVFTGG